MGNERLMDDALAEFTIESIWEQFCGQLDFRGNDLDSISQRSKEILLKQEKDPDDILSTDSVSNAVRTAVNELYPEYPGIFKRLPSEFFQDLKNWLNEEIKSIYFEKVRSEYPELEEKKVRMVIDKMITLAIGHIEDDGFIDNSDGCDDVYDIIREAVGYYYPDSLEDVYYQLEEYCEGHGFLLAWLRVNYEEVWGRPFSYDPERFLNFFYKADREIEDLDDFYVHFNLVREWVPTDYN